MQIQNLESENQSLKEQLGNVEDEKIKIQKKLEGVKPKVQKVDPIREINEIITSQTSSSRNLSNENDTINSYTSSIKDYGNAEFIEN